jgi:hypothetical protein
MVPFENNSISNDFSLVCTVWNVAGQVIGFGIGEEVPFTYKSRQGILLNL